MTKPFQGMSNSDGLLHLISIAMQSAGLQGRLHVHILRGLRRAILASGIADADAQDMTFWATAAFEELLGDEDVPYRLRLTLLEHFASELMAHLSGSFDGDGEAA